MDIQIDLEKAVNRDMILIEKLGKKEASQTELFEFLDRIVIGGASHLPLTTYGPILEAVARAMSELGNPKDGQGKA